MTNIVSETSKEYYIEVLYRINEAIMKHDIWMDELGTMVQDMVVTSIELGNTECGFGHIFYGIEITELVLLSEWREVEDLHRKLHEYGAKAVEAVFQKNQRFAIINYEEAKECSTKILLMLTVVKEKIEQIIR